MVKQWKKSLEQSDILSDGTPFDGANIDAPISDAGGVDWSSKTPKYDSGEENSSTTNTDLVSVSGSGYILGIQFAADDENHHIRIDVDGTTFVDNDIEEEGAQYGVAETNRDSGASYMYFSLSFSPMRFNSSFAVGTGSNFSGAGFQIQAGVAYVLD